MTTEQTPVQRALREKFQHELQQEQSIWYTYPDPTRRAKQTRLRSSLWLSGMSSAREVAVLLTSIKTEQRFVMSQQQ